MKKKLLNLKRDLVKVNFFHPVMGFFFFFFFFFFFKGRLFSLFIYFSKIHNCNLRVTITRVKVFMRLSQIRACK